eukprot:symbB.v1.2.023763.t1/scaffold2144.1/size88043/3
MQAPIFLLTEAGHSHDHDLNHVVEQRNATLVFLDENVILPERNLVFLLWIDGVLYHVQSVIAYVVMSYLSPVTVSVVNTLKRALIICISIQARQVFSSVALFSAFDCSNMRSSGIGSTC